MITKEIYERLIQESCRFLKFNEESLCWEELSPMAARDKVCRAKIDEVLLQNQVRIH